MNDRKPYLVRITLTRSKDVTIYARDEEQAEALGMEAFEFCGPDSECFEIDAVEMNLPDPEGLEPSLKGQTL